MFNRIKLNRVVNSSSVVILIVVAIVVTPQQFAQTLVGHWKMDEGSNYTTLNDETTNNNDAAINGSPTWVSGQDGLALDFDGTTDYANVGDNASLDITAAITLAVWIKPGKSGTQYVLKKATQGSTDGYELSLSSSGKVFVRFNQNTSGNTYRINSTTDYPSTGNTWMHIAATFDGANMKLYIDGVQEGSTLAGPGSIAANSLSLGIGAQGNGSTKFQGAIDDARVYNGALNATEILALATAPSSISFQDGLNSYTGTRDTYIYDISPSTPRGSETTMVQDKNASDDRTSLVLFDLSTISGGTTIKSAYLQFYVDTEGQGFDMHRMLVAWDEATVTYQSLGNRHFAADDTDAEISVNANWPGELNYTGFIFVSVPASTIKDWRDGTLINNGWLMIATHASNGQQLRTREHVTQAHHPKVVVYYENNTAPDAPTNVNISASSHGQIHLTWGDNSDNESSFEIERSPAPSGPEAAFALLESVAANTTSYDDFNLNPGTEYFYRVSAKNGAGTSNHTGNNNSATTPAEAVYALEFNGSTDYVTFGEATSELGVTTFTLEAWVKRAAGGTHMRTGTGGFGEDGRPRIYPVFTKGMGEGDAVANKNFNFILGITVDGEIGADFEDNTNGGNHPVWGTTNIPTGEWHHIAVTYSGSTWMLYLDGNTETIDAAAVQSPNKTPESSSIQHAALASTLQSSGNPTAASGYFSGAIDEVRIWDVVRTGTELLNNKDIPISAPQTNLIGRWGLNEGITLFVNDASGNNTEGSIIGGGTTWIENPMSLPVELSSFTANLNGGTVTLNWRTETELNNYGFEVERTSPLPPPFQGGGGEAGGGWEKVGFVDGHGNSNSPKDYSFIDSNPTGGSKFSYRLKQIDNDGTYEYSEIVEVEFVPTEFALYQNYPNPFNPATKIKYTVAPPNLPEGEAYVIIKVYDVLGSEIATLVNEEKEAGTYEIEFSANGGASGMYVYRMQAGSFVQIKKMLIIK